ncbi:fumarylacetoacetate hydrolase family protein [Geodermatophilus sp. SYSU D00079]
MKLVSFAPAGTPGTADAVPGVLAADDRAVVRLPFASVLEVLDRWDEVAPRLAELATAGDAVPLAEVRLTAPVPRPRTLTAVGLNYRDHAAETGAAVPAEPMFFLLHPASVTGPDETVVLPAESRAVDYEGELGVVIGRVGAHIPIEQAADHIAGYTICNDLSARDVQRRMGQWGAAKSFPGFSPCGPWLVTADEVGDPQALGIATTVDGRTLQKSTTAEMVFSCAELVSRISAVWPLQPGDLIATGTPAGVGIGRTPPVLLADGDVVEVTIERLGTLRTTLRAAP